MRGLSMYFVERSPPAFVPNVGLYSPRTSSTTLPVAPRLVDQLERVGRLLEREARADERAHEAVVDQPPSAAPISRLTSGLAMA